jgi:uncharacterized protein (TIGR00730 family)
VNNPSNPANPAEIAQPAHPQRRREPLPWSQPKPADEDPDAPRRVAEILASPSYREADRDVDFLNRDEARGPRLELDYFKAELLLEQHGITHTVVVFGGTRIPEPLAARRKVERLRHAVENDPGDPELRRQLTVAERIQVKSHYYDVARELGRLVANAGRGPQDCRVVVMTGGGPGIMEAANRGAKDVHGRSVGCNIRLPQEQKPNPYLDTFITFQHFFVRKVMLVKYSYAFIAMPGGFGTLDEVFETATLIQTGKIEEFPVVLVGREYWKPLLDFMRSTLVAHGTIDANDLERIAVTDSVVEVIECIRERALRRFGLTYGPRVKRRWWLGERASVG